AAAVVSPATTAEVARVLRLCNDHGVGVVPQGGNTGRCGGGVPDASGRQIVLSLARLDRIRAVDPLNYTVTAEAGCILAHVQAAAEQADRLFPLSLGAEGSCRIGGNLATNAGGLNVLRYGSARGLTLGLEVVLADGTVWDGLTALRKNNTGYDLKDLFIGSEGTLGVITAAVLTLFPRPREVRTAFVALDDPEAAIRLLALARAASGDRVSAFELLSRTGLEFALRHIAGCRDPFARPCPWYVLLVFSDFRPDGGMGEALEAMLADAWTAGLVQDAVIAASDAQAQSLWRLREGLVEGQRFEGGSIKHDVAVPVARVAEFIRVAGARAEQELPGVRVVAFGHVGDGNIHFNLSQPLAMDKNAFLALWGRFNELIHDIAVAMGGTFSAEHGIGRLKVGEMGRYKSPVELDLMRRIKAVLDPKGIMNPGKVLP
ncbi:MAG: FAD-binding oxidoreductase, partial [Pseudomonadota bacterium]|nr:FAD-binding oxidoreductase [Pseudomonadota bacterium]